MKKLFFILTIVLCIALCACGEQAAPEATPAASEPEIQETQPIESTADPFATLPSDFPAIELPPVEFDEEDYPPVTAPPTEPDVENDLEETDPITTVYQPFDPDLLPPHEFEE